MKIVLHNHPAPLLALSPAPSPINGRGEEAALHLLKAPAYSPHPLAGEGSGERVRRNALTLLTTLLISACSVSSQYVQPEVTDICLAIAAEVVKCPVVTLSSLYASIIMDLFF